jgi:phosphatidate phosphatase APP1
VLDASARDGHFFGTLRLPVAVAASRIAAGRLRYEAITSPQDRRQFHGFAYCLDAVGLSVISDIDDTIKITEVANKAKLLENTFFREFRAVEGLAKVYRRWNAAGAKFHYVSASPWQLYEPLAAFAEQSGFPGGTFHLKRVRLKDASFLKLFADPIEYKLSQIEPLLRHYPSRKFVLVGDSGEKDPEVYGMLARRRPGQIVGICIRNVSGEAADAVRFQQAFRGLPRGTWRIFQDPGRLALPKAEGN